MTTPIDEETVHNIIILVEGEGGEDEEPFEPRDENEVGDGFEPVDAV